MSVVHEVPTAPPWQRSVLRGIGCAWLVASVLAFRFALMSDWPPFGELPTAEQVSEARANAWDAAVVAVLPPVVGALLARRWRRPIAALLFAVGVVVALPASAALLLLTDSPVRG